MCRKPIFPFIQRELRVRMLVLVRLATSKRRMHLEKATESKQELRGVSSAFGELMDRTEKVKLATHSL